MKKEVDMKSEMKKEVKKVQKFVDEFKTFIMRGNVLDLAVGVIVGGAFGKIVTSLVNDILMPLIGTLLGGLDFSNLSWKINDATIHYGMFIQNVVDFLIIAICIFSIVKLVNRLTRKKEKEEEKKVEPPKKEEYVVLLEEIRDLLKEKNKGTKPKKEKKAIKE